MIKSRKEKILDALRELGIDPEKLPSPTKFFEATNDEQEFLRATRLQGYLLGRFEKEWFASKKFPIGSPERAIPMNKVGNMLSEHGHDFDCQIERIPDNTVVNFEHLN